MNADKEQLLNWIEEDRDKLITFLSEFIQARSLNPPGDTREAGAHNPSFRDEQGLAYRVIDPHPEFPNIIGGCDCSFMCCAHTCYRRTIT